MRTTRYFRRDNKEDRQSRKKKKQRERERENGRVNKTSYSFVSKLFLYFFFFCFDFFLLYKVCLLSYFFLSRIDEKNTALNFLSEKSISSDVRLHKRYSKQNYVCW